MDRILLLAPARTPFPDERSQSALAEYRYHRFAEELALQGFEVTTTTKWPERLDADTWFFVHSPSPTDNMCAEVKQRYGEAALARLVPLQARFPLAIRQIDLGAALAVSWEAYGDWLRDSPPEPTRPSYVVVGLTDAAASGLPIHNIHHGVATLSASAPLPELLRRCLNTKTIS